MNDADHSPEALAKRQRDVVGDGPRIAPLANDEMAAPLIDLVRNIRASAGAGDMVEVPEYMRTVARHPELFARQMEMGTTLFQGKIPADEREIAVLRIGWLCRAPYEWGQHVLIAKRVGLTSEDVERVIAGPNEDGWTRHQSAILSAVDQLIENQAVSDDIWDILSTSWDEAQLIEFPMMVGQYVATAYVQNMLRIRLEDDNPGLTRR